MICTDGDQFSTLRLNVLVTCLQLAELRLTESSRPRPIEDNDQFLPTVIRKIVGISFGIRQ